MDPTINDLIAAIMDATQGQARIVFGQMWSVRWNPWTVKEGETPVATFSTDDGEPMPCYVHIPNYGRIEGIGRTYEEALEKVLTELMAQGG